MSVKTLTPWRNDKWEQCDTKHKTHKKFNEKKITLYPVPPAHAPANV